LPVSPAAKYGQARTEAPAFVPNVTREELRAFGWRTLEELLQAQAGTHTSNDRQFADVGLRGFGWPGC